MARSESIVHAHFFHITWEDDCLAFCFAKSKTDQTGRNSNQVWHVYPMPNNPCVCSVLALATYIFANPSLTNLENFTKVEEDGNLSGRLFPGGVSTGDSWIASDELLRRIRMCFLDLEFTLAIWAHIPRGRGRAFLLRREALSAHQWSPFACGQCGVWGRLRSATSSSKKPETSTWGG